MSDQGNDQTGERAGHHSLQADLRRAQSAVAEAELTTDPDERFAAAHLAALRVAAVVLSLRARPQLVAGGGAKPRNVWLVLAEVAPELAEWAGFFAATQPKREAIVQGSRFAVTAREADDLVRDAGFFLSLVSRRVDVHWSVGSASA